MSRFHHAPKELRLFFTGLRLSLKHSGKGFAFALIFLALTGGLLFGFWKLLLPEQMPLLSLKAAVVAQSGDEKEQSLTAALLSQAGLQTDVLPSFQPELLHRYTAVLVLPEGFVNSLLTGENLPVQLYLSDITPLESMFVRQMLTDSLAALETGQRATQTALQWGRGADTLSEQLFLLKLNQALLSDFWGRDGSLLQENIPAAGTASPLKHLLLCIVLTAAFALTFVFASAANWSRTFPRKSLGLFLAGVTQIVVFMLFITICMGIFLGTAPLNIFLSGLLLGGWIYILCRICKTTGAAACVGMGFAMVQLLLCGGILPAVWMPPIIVKASALLPFSQVLRLMQG